MTGPARIVVSVTAEGVVSAETQGIVGNRCLDYVTLLEDLLGARTVESSYTADHQRTAVEAGTRVDDRDVDRA